MLLQSSFVALACVSYAAAHGVIATITANGKTFDGPGPKEESKPALPDSPIRQIGSNGPVKDVSSPDLLCGVGTGGASGKTSGILEVTAGSEISFQMTHWPHRVGPVTLYMAKCPGSADACDESGLKWFKADAKGKEGSTFYQSNMADDKPTTARVPPGLQDGDYLLRYEILALHNAMSAGGAEFYVSCTQARVTGGGSAFPSDSQLVSFPGAYPPDHPGIVLDAFSDKPYDYPGPELFSGDANSAPAPDPAPMPMPDPSSMPMPDPSSMPMPDPSSMPMPDPSSMPMPDPSSMPMPEPSSMPMPEPSSMPMPDPSSMPMPMPDPSSMPMPDPSSMPMPMPDPSSMPMPEPSPMPPQSCKRDLPTRPYPINRNIAY